MSSLCTDIYEVTSLFTLKKIKNLNITACKFEEEEVKVQWFEFRRYIYIMNKLLTCIIVYMKTNEYLFAPIFKFLVFPRHILNLNTLGLKYLMQHL